VVRIFNTYGPRMRIRDGRVIPSFFTEAILGEPLTVYGTGTQTRSFCYVDDLVDGIWRLFQSDYSNPVNLGNPQEFTILEIAKKIREITGSASPIEFHALPVDDPKVRQPDIRLARELLGWSPKVDVEDGLRRTHLYFLEALGKK